MKQAALTALLFALTACVGPNPSASERYERTPPTVTEPGVHISGSVTIGVVGSL